MSDTKMLQALLDGQAAIRKDLSTVKGDLSTVKGDLSTVKGDLSTVKGDLSTVKGEVNGVKEDLKQMERRLTARLDNLGLQIARLEDDSPTMEEFDTLEKRVLKLETQASKN